MGGTVEQDFGEQRPVGFSYFGEPVKGLSKQELAQFKRGLMIFSRAWPTEGALVKPFNGASCSFCHSVPMTGGSGLTSMTFVPEFDASVRLSRFHMDVDKTVIFSNFPSNTHSRRTPGLFGLGLLELISDEQLSAGTASDGTHTDNSRRWGGKENSTKIGRFGLKASQASITEFVLTALNREVGVSLQHQADPGYAYITEDEVLDLTAFVRFLSAPRRSRPITESSKKGGNVFIQLGCSSCHRQSYTVTASWLNNGAETEIMPYTDLAIHDMGPSLKGGVAEGKASDSEWRTAPLWGISSLGPPYLHDGRATTVEEAIILHGGEAELSRQKYVTVNQRDREALLAYLDTPEGQFNGYYVVSSDALPVCHINHELVLCRIWRRDQATTYHKQFCPT